MMPHDNEAFATPIREVVFEALADDHHRYIAHWVELETGARMFVGFLGHPNERLFAVVTPRRLYRLTRLGGGDNGQRAAGLPDPWRLRQCHLTPDQLLAIDQAIETEQSWEALLAKFLNVSMGGGKSWRLDGSVQLE